MENTARRNIDVSTIMVRIIGYSFIGVFALSCLLPFILIISSSLSTEKSIMDHGFSLWPKEFSTFAYEIVFQNPRLVIGSYMVTLGITIVGTAVGLFIVAMTGYALQRQDFLYRNKISFYIYFTTLFSGGLVPFYLLITQVLHLKDNYL